MTPTRTSAYALLLTVAALAACDTLFGPSDEPAAIELELSRDTMDMVGDTLVLGAVVWNSEGDVISNPSVFWTSRDSTVATIDELGVLTARATGPTWVVGRSGGAVDSAALVVNSPIPCLPTGDLTVTDTVTDAIVPGECGPVDRYRDVWRLEIDSPQTITLDLMSGDFNAFLALLDAEGAVVGVNNDGGLNFNARLLIELDAGVYYAVVGPYVAGVGGEYQLSVIRGAHPSPCPATDTVIFPDTVTGATDTGSCEFEGYYIDVWRLELDAPTEVTVQLEGDGFSTYAAVTDTLGWLVAQGAPGPSSGAWMELQLPAGAYDLWVGARERATTGSYTLTVKRGPATVFCPTGSLGIGDWVTAELTDQDCYVWYSAAEGWDLMVDDTADVEMAVLAVDSMDPVILVSDSTGELVWAGFERGSYIRVDTTLVPGAYRVWVQSYSRKSGDFQLSVVEAGAIGACEPTDTAVLDSAGEGALSTTDCALIDGRYTDGWALQLGSATTVTVDLTSDKFDAFLIVRDTLGATIARDDDSGVGTNASLALDFEPGVYHLWATSYWSGTIGGYELTAATTSGAVADLEPLQPGPAGSAADKAGGQPLEGRLRQPRPEAGAGGWPDRLTARVLDDGSGALKR